MKNPLDEKLPIGHHNADQVVALLGLQSKKWLLARLRELGWLKIDNRGLKHSDHNLPKQEIIDAGLAYIKTNTYGAGSDKQIDRSYRKVIFTLEGLETIKGIFKEGKAPPSFKPRPTATKAETIKTYILPKQTTKAAKQEREAAIKSLREMGII